MSKRLNILIPNATGPTNPGDQAILQSLLSLLRASLQTPFSITIHSSDPELYKKEQGIIVKPTIYMWVGFQNTNSFVRLIRLSRLIISFISIKIGFSIIISKELRDLLSDYKNADIIIFSGGGFLRSQKGLTQTINLLMTLAILHFAKLYKKKKIIMPMSFGPFAYSWQEKLTVNTLNEFDAIFLREKISYTKLKKYNIKYIFLSSDLALLPKKLVNTYLKKPQSFVLGFTIREWLKREKQYEFENAFYLSIKNFCHVTKAHIQPIAHVDDNVYGDKDRAIAERIAGKLQRENITVLPVKIIKRFPQDTAIYGNVDMLLGMRMHSLIFATMHNTPFVAVSYEHKTDGFTHSLGLDDFCISYTKVNEKNLTELLERAYKKRKLIKKSLASSLERIQKLENERWHTIFSKLNEQSF